MNKIQIVTKNMKFCKYMINNICDNAKVDNISTSYQESINNIITNKPDVIIFEEEIQYYKVLNLIKIIREIIKYQPLIILINGSNLCNIAEKYKKCIIIKDKRNSIFRICKILKHINDENFVKESLDDKILSQMYKMGFDMKNKGDHLIVLVVKYIKENKNVGTNLEKDVYKSISKDIGVSENQIKWNINYSINSIYEVKPKIMCNYLNIELHEKPTTKVLIFSLLSNL